MPAIKPTLRTCKKGHQYYKSSDCPTCPICAKEAKPKEGFLSLLSAPARRALENEGIYTLKQLSRYSEAQVLALHGMGPSSMPKLREALAAEGLMFKNREATSSGKQKVSTKAEPTKATTFNHIHYHKDGSIWAKGTLVNGEMDGYWEWFRKGGIIMRSGYFNKGKQVGEWTTYDKEGNVHKVTKMKE
jgi:hypothetical protein